MAGKKTSTGKSAKDGIELGVGYVTITTEASKVRDEINKEFGEVEKTAESSGKEAGEKYGTGFGDTVKTGLKAGGVAVGAAAGAGILAGLNDAMAREDLAGTIQAQMGTTESYAAEIADAAGSVFASGWGESLDEVGKSAVALGETLNTLGSGEDLERLTEQATAMAKTFDQDAVQVIQTASSMVTNGMADTMEEAFNIISVGFQHNGKMTDDMLDSLSEYGTAFEQLGLSGLDVVTSLGNAINSGAWNGDIMADAIREYLIIGQEMGKDAAAAYESIGLNVADIQKALAEGGPAAKQALTDTMKALDGIEDPVARSAAAVSIFGTKAEEMQGALYTLTGEATENSHALRNVETAAADVVTNAKGLDEIMAELGRTLNESLGAALTPLIPQLMDLADYGLAFFRWLGENPAITGILLGIGAAIGVITAATWLWNAAQLANPATWIFGVILVAIVGLVASVFWLINNWDTAMKAMEIAAKTAWNGIIHGANGLIHALNGVLRVLERIFSLNGTLGDWNWGEVGTFGLLDVPGLATGGTVTHGGTVMVGEQGPELLKLPAGASVIPLDHPAAAGGGSGTNLTINQYNPLPERGSKSLQKTGQLIGASLV